MNWQTGLRQVDALYRHLIRPAIFSTDAQSAHDQLLQWLTWLDDRPWVVGLARRLRTLFGEDVPVEVGGVVLPGPVIVAAGLVKGVGLADVARASGALASNRNIIPGWRVVPALVGAVEFGSFTPHPRMGNPGRVVWRDAASLSTQNRIGLRNPGARATAAFLGRRRQYLPPVFGLNIAPTPGLEDIRASAGEVAIAMMQFLRAGVRPAWFTLNLSCPNTEDDPAGRQTEAMTQVLCQAAQQVLREAGAPIPLWIKIGPGLSEPQIERLLAVSAETGVRAVVATNTMPMPAPGQPGLVAGAGGGALHWPALRTMEALRRARERLNAPVDFIGCGGVLDGASLAEFRERGACAVQIWSALIYRGPFAVPLIESELRTHDILTGADHRTHPA